MQTNTYTFRSEFPFELENGYVFNQITLSYTIIGNVELLSTNSVWICHGLTANQNPSDWWKEQVGQGLTFDPNKEVVICVNVPGSSYGSVSPLSINEYTGQPYYHQFPDWTIRDVVNAFELLKNHLNIQVINKLVGASVGGMIALQWAAINNATANQLILIATNAAHSPWGKAFNVSQRMALEADASFYSGTVQGGQKGLAAARSLAMLSYRTERSYLQTQYDFNKVVPDESRASGYQRYQGKKMVDRFNAHCYYSLTKLMDSHDIATQQHLREEVLSTITIPTLIVGIDTDVLFPIHEQYYLFEHLPNAFFGKIVSQYGHDAFLIEHLQLTNILQHFFNEQHHEYLITAT